MVGGRGAAVAAFGGGLSATRGQGLQGSGGIARARDRGCDVDGLAFPVKWICARGHQEEKCLQDDWRTASTVRRRSGVAGWSPDSPFEPGDDEMVRKWSSLMAGVVCATLAGEGIVQGGWLQTGALRGSRANHTATLLPSGKVLVAGGDGSAELYDPAAGVWEPAGVLHTPRYWHTATLLP